MSRLRSFKRGTRRPWGILGLLALVLAFSPQPGTPESFEGQVIRSIEYTGNRTLTPETMNFYLGIEEGMILDGAALNQNLYRLWSTNLVDDIRVEAFPAEGGVHLKVEVRERPILRSVQYEGLKRVSRTDIQDKIASERITVREGDPLNFGELYRLKALIERLYREKGYRFADARLTIEEVSANERRALFTIDEGDRVRIADIEFDGNSVYGDWRLKLAMRKTKETNLITRLLKRDIYNPANLEEDLEKVKGIYRAAGYKNILLGEPQIEVRALRPNAPTAKKQKRRMFITIPVEEGERWRFGEVLVEGNETFTDEQLLRAFRYRPGGWLRSKVLDEGVKAVTEAYHNSGYIFARVETEVVERGDNVADLILHIQEDDQFRVGRLTFEGNTKTRDKVLRREFRVQEGYVLNMAALRNSLRKVNQLGYFKLDEDDPVEFANFDREEKTVDLNIQGEESDRTELQFGGGWSEIDGFFGQFALRTQNFLGRGETLAASVQTGRIRNIFDLSYFIPWFLDKPQSVGVQVFRQDLDFTLLADQRFIQKSRGGVFTYGRSLGFFQNVSLSYTNSELEDSRSFFIFGDDGFEPSEPVTFQRELSSLRPVYAFDSRDSRFEPTVGRRFQASVEYAGGVLGGSTNLIRPEVSFSFFRPVGERPVRTVFAINAEGGYVEPFGGQELPFLERYYLGGENSVRGFRFRSIWVREKDGTTRQDEIGFPKGGDKFVQFNVEYHFLMGGPFRAILFVDSGGVFDDDQSIDVSGLRHTAGAELRITLPVFGAPLRFIYAVNLDPLPDDRFENFQFSIGTSF